MKKIAVVMEQIRFKQEEIKKILNDNLIKIKSLITPAKSLEDIKEQINALLIPMNAAINKKVLELASLKSAANTPDQQAKDQIIPGGLGSNLSPKDVDPEELEAGIRVELEHTGNKDLAEEIALDHLAEDPKYYSKLKTIHQDVKDKHLSPRSKKDNKNLPDFWRKNFDYGRSPYSHMDKLKTITDKKLSRRQK